MNPYAKIETLYKRDEKTFKVKVGEFKNPLYSIIKEWEFTEKIDGTNIRCIWTGSHLEIRGRTDKAQVHKDLISWILENVSVKKLKDFFNGVPITMYGEGYGAGIQKGGGNYSDEKKFIMFDMMIGDIWLSRVAMESAASLLHLDTVPYIGTMTLDGAAKKVQIGIKSRFGKFTSEGLVGKPSFPLFDSTGKRLVVKLKTRDF